MSFYSFTKTFAFLRPQIYGLAVNSNSYCCKFVAFTAVKMGKLVEFHKTQITKNNFTIQRVHQGQCFKTLSL
jgi:hypothetical protein